MDILIIKSTENNIIYTTQESHFLLSFDEIISKVSFPSIFSLHSSTNLSIIFFYTYNFYNLNILQYHMIYHIHNHNY